MTIGRIISDACSSLLRLLINWFTVRVRAGAPLHQFDLDFAEKTTVLGPIHGLFGVESQVRAEDFDGD